MTSLLFFDKIKTVKQQESAILQNHLHKISLKRGELL
nr:MAG TPA: hypothetical protein [Microviridae sp.]